MGGTAEQHTKSNAKNSHSLSRVRPACTKNVQFIQPDDFKGLSVRFCGSSFYTEISVERMSDASGALAN
jgi:hypothetical protein